MTTLHVYVEGYDAYLRLLRASGDWNRVVREEKTAGGDPYGHDDALHRAWLEGWNDAVAETYVPWQFLESSPEPVAIRRSA